MARARSVHRTVATYLWYFFAILVISAAVFMTAARLLLPEAKGYRERVELWASHVLGQSVRIASMDASLVGITPTLTFKGVSLMDRSGTRALVRFDEAEIGIGVLSSLRSWTIVPSALTVRGAHLAVTRLRDGRVLVRGLDVANLPGQESGADEAAAQLTAWLFQRDRLAVKDSVIRWRDLTRGGRGMQFSGVNIWLRNRGKRHQLDARVVLPEAMGHDLSLAIDVSGDVLQPASLAGHFYVEGNALHLARLGWEPRWREVAIAHGDVDFRLWGEWRDGTLKTLQGNTSAYSVAVTAGTGTEPLRLDWLSGLFRWQQGEDGWSLDVDKLHITRGASVWPASRLHVARMASGTAGTPKWEVRANFVRIEDVAQLLVQSQQLDERAQSLLTALHPVGDLHALQLSVETPPDQPLRYVLQGRFTQLGFNPWHAAPGAQGLSGALWLDNGAGRLQLDSRSATVDFPRLFRSRLAVQQVLADVAWRRAGGLWSVTARNVELATKDLRTSSDVLLDIPDNGASPYLDLQVAFRDGNVASVSTYLPARIMDSGVVKWLDEALISGRVTDGGMVFNGRLRDFPFERDQGQFLVRFRARNLVLAYQKDWPRFEQLQADAKFTGEGMAITARSGKVLGSDLQDVVVDIDAFRRPVLTARGTIEGDARDAVRFLARSPIAAAAADTLEGLDVSGKAATDIQLTIPLTHTVAAARPLRVQGSVRLNEAGVNLAGGMVDVRHLNGTVHFDQHSQHATGIDGEIMGSKATFGVYSQGGSDPATVITARGRVGAAQLAKRLKFSALTSILNGASDWQGVLTLRHGKRQDSAPVELQFGSDLAGMGVELPAPLRKAPQEHCALAVDIRFAADHRPRLRIDYGQRLSAVALLDTRGTQPRVSRAELRFGATPAQLPGSSVLRVAGSVNEFEPLLWGQTLARLVPGGAASAVTAAHARLPVVFDLARLHIVKAAAAANSRSRSDNGALDPRTLPLVSGTIRDLSYDKIALGDMHFTTARTATGLAVRDLSLASQRARMSLNGAWEYSNGHATTHVDAKVVSSDFGAFLSSLDLAAVFKGGKSELSFDLAWPQSPFSFSFATVHGSMRAQIKDGTMEEVNPGAGRLFGLLSLQALPRRLTLDFSDVFKKGFTFDSIDGNFTINGGNAVTNDLLLKSPSARILVQGRTGLVKRDYDQLVTVVPAVGNTLPVAGGLAFGPQAGALILLFQNLFKKEIDKVAQYQYKLTGSWENPVIERLNQATTGHASDQAAPPAATGSK